jgi:BirA family biotin operon repressor/biotin-[acetyl-CoA-carboxylase] ligase
MTIKDKILGKLISNKGTPVSGEKLASELSVSRAAVWKHIKTLRGEGYMIDSSTNRGYSLTGAPDLLAPAQIKAGLNTCIIGKEIHYFKEIESTNTKAREIAHSAEEGTVVIAETQSGGKGRIGRKWLSPEGGIWLSIILKPKIQPLHAARLTLLAGLAAAKTIQGMGIEAKIKWPNDVLVKGKKVCGILTEMEAELDRIDYCVVGIGINANVDTELFPEEIRDLSTSLERELGHAVNRNWFVSRLLEEFEKEYLKFRNGEFSSILEEWRKMLGTIGEYVKITTQAKTIYGEAVGVDDDGTLVIETHDGSLEKIVAGTCEHLRRT